MPVHDARLTPQRTCSARLSLSAADTPRAILQAGILTEICASDKTRLIA